MANPVVTKTLNDDGWKVVTMDDEPIGHVKKVGDGWRALVGRTEHLGFKTSKSAAMKLKTLKES